MAPFDSPVTTELIETALREDAAHEDPSVRIFDDDHRSEAAIVAKEPTVAAGLPLVRRVFEVLGGRTSWRLLAGEGEHVGAGTVVARGEGRTSDLLRGERTALNFAQRACGIAAKTAAFVQAGGAAGPAVVDTRKTVPGHRRLDKYAVRCGGGHNHRHDLAGGVIVKENHIEAAGGVGAAVERIRREAPHTLRIEVETETLSEVRRAVEAGADIVMLDNMTVDEMETAVDQIRGRADDSILVEASGEVTVARMPELAELDLDLVSVGAITHSVDAADLSMRLSPPPEGTASGG